MRQRFINNYSTKVAATFGAGDSQLRVESVANLPALADGEYFLLTVYRQVGIEESGHEVIKVTGIIGDVLTVQRAVEGAAASQFLAGDRVQARVTALSLQDKADQLDMTAAQAAIAANVAAINTKASQTALDATNVIVSSKAAQDDLLTLINTVLLKANSTDVAVAIAQAKADLVNSSPAALDTLNELAMALGNDANFATSMSTALGNRVRVDIAQALTGPQQTTAKTNIGLNNVDNTADTAKPVSTAQATAIALKQDALVSATNIKTINGVSLLGNGDMVIAAAGGLTNFTESVNTATPNATVPVVSVIATNAATSVDASFSPKGTGALTAHSANNGSTGGNKRGAYAVDWQLNRSLNTKVASGNSSVISGGVSNEASGGFSVISGGNSNSATGPSCVVSGGANNTASSNYSVVSGGASNTTYGDYSTIPGGSFATTRGITGAYAWASRGYGSGKSQTEQFILRSGTNSTSPVRLTTDALGVSTINGPVMPTNSTYYVRIRVVARDTNSANGDSASWTGNALITKGSFSGSTALIGSPTLVSDFGSASLSSCTVTLSADTTYGGLAVTVTGIATNLLNWVAHIETLEVTN